MRGDAESASAVIRPAVEDDLAVLREIEWTAGQRYREYGLDHVADDEPLSLDVLHGYAADGRAWVALDGDRVVGYIVVDEIDGAAHIEQVSVLPAFQGQGVGRALIDRVRGWAASRGMPSLTLTTFRHLPWNRPLYEHLGFRLLSLDDLGPGLQAVRDRETAEGLDPELRVVMRADLQLR